MYSKVSVCTKLLPVTTFILLGSQSRSKSYSRKNKVRAKSSWKYSTWSLWRDVKHSWLICKFLSNFQKNSYRISKNKILESPKW